MVINHFARLSKRTFEQLENLKESGKQSVKNTYEWFANERLADRCSWLRLQWGTQFGSQWDSRQKAFLEVHVQRKRQTLGRIAGWVVATTAITAAIAAAVATAVTTTVAAVVVVQILHVVCICVQFGLRFFLAQVRLISAHLHGMPNWLVKQQVVHGIRSLYFGFHLDHCLNYDITKEDGQVQADQSTNLSGDDW